MEDDGPKEEQVNVRALFVRHLEDLLKTGVQEDFDEDDDPDAILPDELTAD